MTRWTLAFVLHDSLTLDSGNADPRQQRRAAGASQLLLSGGSLGMLSGLRGREEKAVPLAEEKTGHK